MKNTGCFCCGMGRSEWVCGRSGLVRRALTEDDCANVQVCRYVVLQCALCNGDVLVVGVQAGRAGEQGRKRASIILQESISGVVRRLGSKKKGKCAGALWPGKKPCVAGLSVLLCLQNTRVRAVRYY